MRTTVGIALLVGCTLALAACGDESDTVSSKGMALPEISKTVAASAPDGRKIDPGTIRSRSMSGRWVGKIDADKVEIAFGANETFSMQIMSKGSLIDAATGRYAWNPDGTLSGTTSGGGTKLGAYAKWNATFAADVLTVAGSGASVKVVRYRSQPVGNPVGVVDGRIYPSRTGGMMVPPAPPATVGGSK